MSAPVILIVGGGKVAHLRRNYSVTLCGAEERYLFDERRRHVDVFWRSERPNMPICKHCAKEAAKLINQWAVLGVSAGEPVQDGPQ